MKVTVVEKHDALEEGVEIAELTLDIGWSRIKYTNIGMDDRNHRVVIVLYTEPKDEHDIAWEELLSLKATRPGTFLGPEPSGAFHILLGDFAYALIDFDGKFRVGLYRTEDEGSGEGWMQEFKTLTEAVEYIDTLISLHKKEEEAFPV